MDTEVKNDLEVECPECGSGFSMNFHQVDIKNITCKCGFKILETGK